MRPLDDIRAKLATAEQWIRDHSDQQLPEHVITLLNVDVPGLIAAMEATPCEHMSTCPAHPDRTLIHDPDERA